jgi:hypothetical protein
MHVSYAVRQHVTETPGVSPTAYGVRGYLKKIQDTFGPYGIYWQGNTKVHTKNKVAVILGIVHCPLL